MFLKELAELWVDYNKCGALRLAKTVYSYRKIREYWYVWAASIFYGVASFLVAFNDGVWFWGGLALVILSFILLFFAVEKSLQKEYAKEYEAYGIALHPLGRRRIYLRYAIFSKEIKKHGRTNSQLKKLLELAKVADKPALPFRLSDHYLIVPFLTVLLVLVPEYIKDSNAWQAGIGFVFIFLIGMGGLFLLVLLDVIRDIKQKESEFKRFLEWATFDTGGQL